ncbi:MAG: helix-turn-helix domain-containing protein [Actinomycetota bacterium]|nr:helix-turn-helix domain-containing protein [Actinomycetota bacterium]
MSFLTSLSPDARDELRVFVQEAALDLIAARERTDARREWLRTEEAAEIVSCSENAIRCRLRRGWLDGDVVRVGKRLLVRRSALLDWLDERARR